MGIGYRFQQKIESAALENVVVYRVLLRHGFEARWSPILSSFFRTYCDPPVPEFLQSLSREMEGHGSPRYRRLSPAAESVQFCRSADSASSLRIDAETARNRPPEPR